MHKLITHRGLGGILTVLLLLTLVLPAQAVPVRLDPRLVEYLANAPGGQDSFLVFLEDQADLSGAPLIAEHTARVAYVYDALRSTAERSQASLRADLAAWGVDYHPFYIVNAIQVTGDLALARRLAGRPEVARLIPDPAFDGLDDPPPGPPAPPAVDTVEWNIARTNADDVWALGYTGQGIVVGSVDTGVEYTHPALVNQYRGNLGGGNFDHNYNWHDSFGEYVVPTDPNGHGTHTTGTMVGDDGAGNQVGMAPGAEWISCKADSQSGVWRSSKYIECWEWMLAPTDLNGQNPRPDLAAHVINNSWSCPGGEGCDLDTLLPAAEALYAAGIAIAKSGGNSGPNCSTITNPGQYSELLATASFAQGDTISSFSSRGPVTYQGETRIKPDIAAPGSSIRSAYPGGGYNSLSGTSMASPHTAGLIALLWSARPALIGDLATTYQVVRSSAEPKVDLQCEPNGPGGRPNNVWGWGIIDALAAVQAGGGIGTLYGTVYDNAFTPVPGATVEIVQASNHLRRTTTADGSGDYSFTVLAATYDITATHYGYLPGTAAGVVVGPGASVQTDLVMDAAAAHSLSGYVADATSGAPLRAILTLLDTPVSAQTDPATGFYTATAAEGTYTLRAASPGYVPQDRAITVTGNLVEDFDLQPEPAYALRDSTLPCGPAFDWIEISGSGQPYNLGDDAYAVISLPRPFTFYGQPYTNLFAGSNGQISFDVTGANYPGGNSIPDPFAPNNTIYAFWDDLNPANGSQGTLYAELVDDRYFVLEYDQVQHYPSGSPETFEAVLDMDTGMILLQYLVVNDTHWTTVGVENSTGAAGLSYAFHDPAYPTSTQALVLIPHTGAYPVEQGPGVLSGTVVETGTLLPIAGAEVMALDWSGSYTTATDAGGVYTLPLCAGLYTVTAGASGYTPSLPEQVAVYSGTTTVHDFALEPLPPCEPVGAADFTWLPTDPGAGQEITFQGAASGTSPIAYAWDMGDGAFLSGETITHAYALPGVYTVILTATNCATATATAVHTVTVVGVPQIVLPPAIPSVALNPGQQAFNTFTVANTGTAELVWSLAEVPDASWLEEAPVSGTVAPSDSAEVLLTYTAPMTTGVYTTVLRIASNDPVSPAVDLLVELDVIEACAPVSHTGFTWTPITPSVGQLTTFTAWSAVGWLTQTVDVGLPGALEGGLSGGPPGGYTSLALDSAGRPCLSYVCGVCSELRYAWFDGTDWLTETVGLGSGGKTSLVIDAAGRPHIAYSAVEARHAFFDGTMWYSEVVDSSGYETSLGIDPTGHPHIAYIYRDSLYDLRHAVFDGTAWQTTTVESAGEVWSADLALDAAGRPHIAYNRGAPYNDLSYASFDGTSWATETVDSDGNTGVAPALALDAGGHPHIAYCRIDEVSGYCTALKYATWDGSVWQVAALDHVTGIGSIDLSLDTAGRPLILYVDATAGVVRYAWFDGASWHMGPTNLSGQISYLSTVVDASGSVHLSYADWSLRTIVYAWAAQVLPTPPITYTWDFGDGNTGSGAEVTHAFAAAGTYTVTVTASNGCGQATAVHLITVVHRIYLPIVTKDWTP